MMEKNYSWIFYSRYRFAYLAILVGIFLTSVGFAQQTAIKGRVLSENTLRPIEGVSVGIKGTDSYTKTDSLGQFEISTTQINGVIIVTHIGYKSANRGFSESDKGSFDIILLPEQGVLEEVIVSTGYQSIPKERVTGSFDYIGTDLINRSTSTNLLSRLENLSPGLLFNHGDAANTDAFLIRGRSTINGQAQPLIVLDDFPYNGNLSNINPNDIASISILKDAAAASIWGARAGNGVIVITTKKGSTADPKMELISNISITPRPNLHNVNQMAPADRVELDRFLFENGRYSGAANPISLGNMVTAIPESVELMIENPDDLEVRLRELGKHNVLDDLSKHFYRPSVTQQYNLNISGRQDKLRYYVSGGFDKNVSSLVGEGTGRISIRSTNTYQVNDRLSIDASVNLYNVEEKRGNNRGVNTSATSQFSLSPYSRLADERGRSLPVYIAMRKGFVDTVGNGKLLDWNYRPLDEIENELHTVKIKDNVINVGSNYRILDGLEALLKYQYQSQVQQAEDLFREESYYARNNINDYTQINQPNGAITYPFPRGGILWKNNSTTTSHQGRTQINLDKTINDKHSIVGLAGFEIRKLVTSSEHFQNLGFIEETGSLSNNINTEEYYPRIASTAYSQIPVTDATDELRDNFLSYFTNIAYTYDNRYTVTGSFRKDEANLFGLNANQKGTPLWSIGGAWQLNNESFYNVEFLPYTKLRIAYGVNGNIARNASALATMATSPGGFSHPLPNSYLLTLPNKNLAWERVKQLNVGMDFAIKGNRVSGTIEVYNKIAADLLAQSPVDPTYGISSMYLNVANMSGRGMDIQLNSMNLIGGLKWYTSLIYSHINSKITEYLMPTETTGLPYLPISLANPLVGRPLYSVFALPLQGLDRETGDPIGLVNGEESLDYNAIYNGTSLEDLLFYGTAQPTHFGSIRNTFNFLNFDLSFNISYKYRYYFRSSSISYTNMYAGNWLGHSDYGLRWQKPGDELFTNVPSRTYPTDPNRDYFYQYSEALVVKGDHIRFEDINFGYTFSPKKGMKSIRLFAYISNLGILWKANDLGIDPYYNNLPLQKPNFSFGTNLIF